MGKAKFVKVERDGSTVAFLRPGKTAVRRRAGYTNS
jgi:hypothetical protein